MRSAFKLALTLLCIAALSSPAGAKGPSVHYGDLLKRLPDDANLMLLVDVEGLFNSPLGQREKWREKAANRPTGILGVTADAARFAVAEGIDLQTLDERWKLGMLQTNSAPPALSVLATREGGYVEQIESQNVAWTPRNLYLLAFPERIVGFAVPAERQLLARWIQKTIIHPRNFPPGWADRAIYRADMGTQIVLGVDLTKSISPKRAQAWLKSQEELIKKRIDPELLGNRLADATSALLQIDVKETIQGTILVEFSSPIDYVKYVAKDLILATLDAYGAQIEELKSWNSEVKGNTISISGKLSEEAVRRILSLVAVPRLSPAYSGHGDEPISLAETSKGEARLPQTPTDLGLKATQQYYHSVADIAQGLKKQKFTTYRSERLWYDRAAKQIEDLPLLNVDTEVLDWGSTFARTFREMSLGINYASKDQTYRIAGTPNGFYGGYGYANDKGYAASVIKKQSDAVMSVQMDSRWQALEISISDMRRKLVEKYKVNF